MITLEEARNLEYRQTIYNRYGRNADGSPERWRVNGKLKEWKNRPGEFRLPIKWGLKTGGYLTHQNAHMFTLTEEEAIKDAP